METNDFWPQGATRRAGRWRFSLRFVALGFLAAVVGLPVGAVHSVQLPKIQKLSIIGNDLKVVRGVGAPGQLVWLWKRQRNFKEDDHSPLNFNCSGNSDEWLQLTDLDNVGEDGNFVFDGLDLMVLPSGTGFQSCNAALLTEFLVAYGPLPDDIVPKLHMLNIPNYLSNDPEKWVEAEVEFADEVGIMITDGPNDTETALGGIDIDEDGIDLCAVPGLGCGSRVSYLASGGTFPAPSIFEHDGSTFGLPPQVDAEYQFILSMLQAHGNGASLLAAVKVPRDEPPNGGALQVNVKVKAKIDIDCNGSLFDLSL